MPIHLYVGTTGSGKTTKAVEDAIERSAATGLPISMIDSEGVTTPDGFTLPDGSKPLSAMTDCSTSSSFLQLYYEHGKHVRRVPTGKEEVAGIFRAVRTFGGPEWKRPCIMLLEEAVHWTRHDARIDDLERVVRIHRHLGVELFITTQYVSDIAPIVLQCADTVSAFRTPSKRALDRLEIEYGLDPGRLSNLKVGEFDRWSKWSQRS